MKKNLALKFSAWLDWRRKRPHPSMYAEQAWFRAAYVMWLERRP